MTPLSTDLSQAGYRQVSSGQGVTMFKHASSRDMRYAVEGLFSATPARLMAILVEYERQSRFMPRLSRSQILQRGPGWLIVYQRLALPTISDRDYVLRVTWGTAAETSWLSYSVTDQGAPPRQSGVVRVRRHDGAWQFRWDPRRRATLGRFEWTIDLAGWVPRWMVRSRLAKELVAVFPRLRLLTAASTGKRP